MLLLEPDSQLVTELAPSPNHYDGYYERKSSWVGLHTMETPENSTVARNIATGWFSRTEAQASVRQRGRLRMGGYAHRQRPRHPHRDGRPRLAEPQRVV